MKKLTKIISCLTAAAIICSAGVLSACSSNVVSDEVTSEEWEAAFADENFYNVTIDFTQNNNGEDNSTHYNSENIIESYSISKLSGNYNQTFKYDLTPADEILLGNFYCCENGKYENLYEYQNEDYPEYNMNEEETREYTDYEYYLYYEQCFNNVCKTVNDGEEGEWYTYSSSHPVYVEEFSFDTIDYGRTHLLSYVVNVARNQEFEYKDGAYVYSYDNDYSNYLDQSFFELAEGIFELTEFTGGTTTYSVIIKDGKVYSIKYNYSYELSYTLYGSNDNYESYSLTCKWTFSDYGTTTVTVPDEVSALFE